MFHKFAGGEPTELVQKTIVRPSAEMAGPAEASVPAGKGEMRRVWPVCRSWTKTSLTLLVSSGVRLDALEKKAT